MKLTLETDNPAILESVKKIFKKQGNEDFWQTIPKNQQEEILKGIKETEKGENVDYEEFI
ncbi:MAG: hypothetical protein M0Q90_05665 [Bacteroidales bacterium]|nr:hypothetical protein [Bacteroidales bacterium]